MKPSLEHGFSLGELIVALGLFAVAILSVLALAITMARGSQEGEDRAVAGMVATSTLESVVDRVRGDVPPGTAQGFWDNDSSSIPWDEADIVNNGTTYQYKIFATDVLDTSGDSVGGVTPQNRLKKVDIVIHWWDSETQNRQGYGRLEVRNTRLVSEGET